MRGRIRRAPSFAEDVDPAVFFRITARRYAPVYPHLDQLSGRVWRGRGSPTDYVPNAPFIITIPPLAGVTPSALSLSTRVCACSSPTFS